MTLGAGAASVRAAASAETQMYAVYEGQDTERSLWQLHARAVIASQIASGQKTQQ
jgi:hypothetical protein